MLDCYPRMKTTWFLMGIFFTSCAPAQITRPPLEQDPTQPAAPEASAQPASNYFQKQLQPLPVSQGEKNSPSVPSPSHSHGEKAPVEKPASTPSSPKPVSPTFTPKVMYTCPMHPDVQMDHPGTCPKCGMTLVPKVQKEAK